MTCLVTQKYRKLRLTIALLFGSIFMTSCMDLASNESKDKQASVKKISYRQGQVYTMRGLGGVFSRGMNRLEDTLENDHSIRTSSTIWYKFNNLSDFIIKNHKNNTLQGPIILIGHSLGANEQIKVAKNLARENIAVDLLLTVDAVAPIAVPANVKNVFNIYKPGLIPMISGRAPKAADPAQTHIDNYDVTKIKNLYVNHITIDKNNRMQKIMLDKVLATLQDAKKIRIS